MTPLRRVMAFAGLLCFASAARGEHVTLLFEPHGGPPNARAVTVSLRRVTKQTEAAAGELRLVSDVGAAGTIDVPAGQWAVDVESDAYWHRTQFLVTSGRDGNIDLRVPLWRSGVLTATVKMRDGTTPREIKTRFSSSDLEGQSDCTLSENKLECRVPAGVFDLRLRCQGCIAHYAFDHTVPEGGASALGDVVFQRGAAIVGKIALDRNLNARTNAIRVRAVSNGAARPEPVTMSAVADARGFFHIDGVLPGQYTITAYGPESSQSSPVSITIRGAAEAQLAEPLLIQRRRTLTIDLLPLLDPAQKPWLISVQRMISAGRAEAAIQHEATPSGQWTSPLRPGNYLINVSSSDGSVWRSQELNFSGDERLAMALVKRTVRGRLLLGDKPVAATLTFGGEFGARNLVANSDERGRFEIALPVDPDGAEWPLTVDGETPRVKRTLNVKLPEDPGAELIVALPSTVVSGVVVDTEGKPVSDVQVNVSGPGGAMTQTNVQPDGSFAINGLLPGAYRVQADGFLFESDPYDVTIPADGSTDELKLTVKPVRKITGRIVSNDAPVAGASVLVRATDVPSLYSRTVQTDEHGLFATVAPPSAQEADFFIAAPGFAFKAFHATLPDRRVRLNVEQSGGELIARWIRAGAVLIHNGAVIPPLQLTGAWSGSLQMDHDTTVLAAAPLEPGTYSLCTFGKEDRATLRNAVAAALTDPRCVNTFLPPHGAATLDATIASGQ
jgi:hypothetical protein